jgi:hypothetical protein
MNLFNGKSVWDQLAPEHQDTLDGWLFDEALSCAETLPKAQAEFGLSAPLASLDEYYHRRALELQGEKVMRAQMTAQGLNDLPVKTAELRAVAVKLAGTAALRLSAEKPGQWRPLAGLTKLLLHSERNDLQRDRLRLAEKARAYDTTAASLSKLPHIRAWLEMMATDSSVSEQEKAARFEAILTARPRPATSRRPSNRGGQL